MMTYRWLFVAITLFLVDILIFQQGFFSLLLLSYWLVRLWLLRDRALLVFTCGLTLVLVGRIYFLQTDTHIPEDLTEAYIFVKPTSFDTNGDTLRFEGWSAQYEESLVVSYKVQSKAEKDYCQEKVPVAVKVRGSLQEPAENTNIHQFNYRNYLKRRQIYYVFYADKLESVSGNLKLPVKVRLDWFRHHLLTSLDNTFEDPLLSYIKALFFADMKAMEAQTIDLYKTLGIIHLISISGLHIDLIIKVISKLLGFFKVSREGTGLVLMVVLPWYLVLTGFGVSVFRSVTMAVLAYLTSLLELAISKTDIWALTLIIAIFINPLVIYSIGFQLSYGISGLLIITSETHLLDNYRPLTQILLINLMVNLFSIPIITYHYFEYPLLALGLNLIYVPIFSALLFPLIILTLVLGILLGPIGLVGLLNSLVNQLVYLSEYVLGFIGKTQLVAFLTFVPGRLNVFAYFIIGLSLLIIFTYLNRLRSKWLYLALATYLLTMNINRLSPMGNIYMIDVGQGDSIVIKPPLTNQGILIDTGGHFVWQTKEDWQEKEKTFSLAEDEVIPTLKSLGVRSLKTIYLSHGDFDHIGEVSNLTHSFQVDKIAGVSTTLASDLFQSVDLAERTDVSQVQVPFYQEELGIKLLGLHPENPTEDHNDASLVLYGQFGQEYWLFTGDLEAGGEAFLMESYPNLEVDALKVGHHGSLTSTSSDFVNFYQPRVSLISVGENNSYGHPHPEVLENLNQSGSEIYRTDQDGGILYRYSNNWLLNRLFCGYKTVK